MAPCIERPNNRNPVPHTYKLSGLYSISAKNDYYVNCPVDPGGIQGSHWPIVCP